MARLRGQIAHSSTKPKAKPLIGSGQKAAHYEQLVFDTELSPLDVRIGIAIGSHVDRFKTGLAKVGRETIARRLGVSVRAVEQSTKRLETRGHIEVSRRPVGVGGGRVIHGGRGGCNEYRLVWQTPNGGSLNPSTYTANRPSSFGPQRANFDAPKGEQQGSNERTDTRSNPDSTSNLSLADASGAPNPPGELSVELNSDAPNRSGPRPLPRAVAEAFPEIGRKYGTRLPDDD